MLPCCAAPSTSACPSPPPNWPSATRRRGWWWVRSRTRSPSAASGMSFGSTTRQPTMPASNSMRWPCWPRRPASPSSAWRCSTKAAIGAARMRPTSPNSPPNTTTRSYSTHHPPPPPPPPNQFDFPSQLLKTRSAKPDALILALYPPDHLLFTRQLAEQRLDLTFGVHSAGGGAEDPSFYAAIDASMTAYYFVQEDWQVDILDTNQDPLLLDADRRARALLGYGMSASVALGLAANYVLGDALERAGSAERDKPRDAIAATDLSSGPALFTGYQRIKFDSAGQNTFAHGVVSENLGGKRRAIWPSENRAADT